jgi:hypothetical protein
MTGGGLPLVTYGLDEFLGVEGDFPEADIEASTAVGDRAYWITSHGRDREGELRPNRYRFFATDVRVVGEEVEIEPVGEPYRTLAQDMVDSPLMAGLGLEEATRFGEESAMTADEIQALAPKNEGLNIEGLCAAADGSGFLIGLRNPRPVDPLTGKEMAIIARLSNPESVALGEGPAHFEEPLLWDLDGRGVRSMEYLAGRGEYLISAGSADDHADFALYRWSGDVSEQPLLIRELDHHGLRVEALASFEDAGRVLSLSDDGTLWIDVDSSLDCVQDQLNKDDECPNKFLMDPSRKTFRGEWIDL